MSDQLLEPDFPSYDKWPKEWPEPVNITFKNGMKLAITPKYWLWTYNKFSKMEFTNGDIQWLYDSNIHRNDKPATILINEKQEQWWQNGLLHRLDGPAITGLTDNSKEWYVYGHRMPQNSTPDELKIFYDKIRNDKLKPLGKGTFGCAYDGILACKNKIPPRCDDCITKRFRNDIRDYKDEVQMANKIASIDNNGKYHFKIIDKCDASAEYKTTCEDLKNPPQIYYKKGEKSLHSIILEIEDTTDKRLYFQTLRGLSNLFDGLVLFATQLFVHHDIKSNNIIQDKSGKFKFIDFGLAQSYKSGIIKNSQFAHNKYWYPPETLFLAYDRPDKKIIHEYASKYVDLANEADVAITNINKDEDTYANLVTILLNRSESDIKIDVTKIDVFALGILLNDLLMLGDTINAFESDKDPSIEFLGDISSAMTKWDADERDTPQRAKEYYEMFIDDLNKRNRYL